MVSKQRIRRSRNQILRFSNSLTTAITMTTSSLVSKLVRSIVFRSPVRPSVSSSISPAASRLQMNQHFIQSATSEHGHSHCVGSVKVHNDGGNGAVPTEGSSSQRVGIWPAFLPHGLDSFRWRTDERIDAALRFLSTFLMTDYNLKFQATKSELSSSINDSGGGGSSSNSDCYWQLSWPPPSPIRRSCSSWLYPYFRH